MGIGVNIGVGAPVTFAMGVGNITRVNVGVGIGFVWLAVDDTAVTVGTGVSVAAGVPVIATKCGGPEDIRNEENNGVLVRVGDPADLAERIWQLMLDPAKRIALGKEGQRKARKARRRLHILFGL